MILPVPIITLALACASTAVLAEHHPEERVATPQTTTNSGSEILSADRKGRPTMRVTINGRGPFAMVIDTAAQVTLVSPDLAEELSLPKLSEELTVEGATGASSAALYGVDSIRSGLFDQEGVAVVELRNSGVTDARGIVGIDMVGQGKLIFDNAKGRVTAAPSGAAAPGQDVIQGRLNEAGMLMIPLMINGQRVEALVDSGAEGTIAGSNLIELLGWSRDDERLKDFGTMSGAGNSAIAARWFSAESLQLGPARLGNVPIVIQEGASVSQENGPSIILGANVLGALPGYAIDFEGATFELLMPQQ